MIRFQSLPRQKRQAIRREVLRMYAETDMSYGEIAEVNGIQWRTVAYIIRNFASELPQIAVMRKKKTDISSEDYDALRAEVTRLRKELRHEKMRAEALDTMIDVDAGRESGPPIGSALDALKDDIQAEKEQTFAMD